MPRDCGGRVTHVNRHPPDCRQVNAPRHLDFARPHRDCCRAGIRRRLVRRCACGIWQSRAPLTPHGIVERIEFRVDGEGTLAVWTDEQTVTELVALCPWTDRGLGYAYNCTGGSPFHLIFVTESGEELDVILAEDDCPTSEPAWRNGRAGWTTPRLLTRVGELLGNEPAAGEYAEQFDEDERKYRARWLYWADDPWHVRSED